VPDLTVMSLENFPMKEFKSTAQKDRHYICEIGKLFWGKDKQCYAPDAVYSQVLHLIKQVKTQPVIKADADKKACCSRFGVTHPAYSFCGYCGRKISTA